MPVWTVEGFFLITSKSLSNLMSFFPITSPVNFDLAEALAVLPTQLVFIDRNIPDYEVLAAGVVPGLRVVSKMGSIR
jgi:hypothetical protein